MSDSRRTSLAIMPGKEGKSIDKNSYQNRKIGVLTSGGDAQGNVNIAGLAQRQQVTNQTMAGGGGCIARSQVQPQSGHGNTGMNQEMGGTILNLTESE